MNSTLECVTDWILRQRWYAGKSRLPELRELSREEWPTDDADARIVVLLVMDYAGHLPTLYHVPLVVRQTIPRGSGPYLIGRNAEGEYLFDGPHDPAYTAELFARVAPGFGLAESSAALTGEQSNTSVRFDIAGRHPIICKVFRALHNGENPDVTLQGALSQADSPYVPHFVGAISHEWPDSGEPSGRAIGHIAFAQEFLTGVRDGWSTAVEMASESEDFSSLARQLGEATAAIHTTLAAVLPTQHATTGDIVVMVAAWHRRLAIAISEVPELAASRERIEAVYDRAQSGDWPQLQRIHGDLHLGQTLLTPEEQWVIVDFEGEPLRPMRERMSVDVPLRDIAGMLRSFGYAAGSAREPGRETDSSAWSQASRAAYLSGYDSVAVNPVSSAHSAALLGAFELDKAIYEAVYEVRNRPDWLGIPLRGIQQILATYAPTTVS